MSITDELRERAHGFHTFNEDMLLAIADRIDAVHQKALEQERNKGFTDGYDMGFASADDWLAQHEDAMVQHGWVRLPKDADGVPIHVGERVQLIGNDPSTVSHMSLADDGWRVYVKYDGGIGTGSGEPKRIRHYHAPTVEDVLAEFGIDWEYESDCEDRAALLKEYAAKLMLKED